ncbi:hypothetical protein BDK61_3297 [Haloarcula quadrata]|uniref:Uncharacterized protein n=2 Tax=Haloarcula quadrata TaxID=182779 RepID=A0A495R9T3_9EURY|nr:hypothetical protein BDK61_3297 [Haloarcula quadrata]
MEAQRDSSKNGSEARTARYQESCTGCLTERQQACCSIRGSVVSERPSSEFNSLNIVHHDSIYVVVQKHVASYTMTQQRYQNGKQVIRRWDEVFKAVAVEPRRQLIVALLDAHPDETVPLPESAINPNVPQDLEVLRQELYHCHLPMLSDHEFITWESEPLVAGRGPRFDEVGVVIDSLQSNATGVPDSLVFGCQRLERERQERFDDSVTE